MSRRQAGRQTGVTMIGAFRTPWSAPVTAEVIDDHAYAVEPAAAGLTHIEMSDH